jgi:tRNA 2-thiocytidine biosynthesis protein TtcA
MSTNPSLIEKKLLHYTGKAIADFNMIQRGDRVMVCLSGGKDSFTLLTLLNLLRRRSNNKFEVFAFTYCSLCSRLRRGIIYRYAEEKGYTKIALGHHRDDLIRTLLMSMFYNGDLRSMPPKLLSDNKKHIVIRPLCYAQEKDIIQYAKEQAYPIIPCNLCGSQENLMRKRVTKLIDQLSEENPKVPSNLLHALQSIKPSQLMDQDHWQFKNLESQLINATVTETDSVFSEEELLAIEET